MAANAGIMHMDDDQFTLATESEEFRRQHEAFLNRNRKK